MTFFSGNVCPKRENTRTIYLLTVAKHTQLHDFAQRSFFLAQEPSVPFVKTTYLLSERNTSTVYIGNTF